MDENVRYVASLPPGVPYGHTKETLENLDTIARGNPERGLALKIVTGAIRPRPTSAELAWAIKVLNGDV